jgi:excisionase family DNA binding protein
VGTKQAAAMLGLSVSTVQKLVASGVLEAWRTGGGHRRILLSSIERELGKARDLAPRAAPRALRLMIVEDNRVASAAYAAMIRQWGGRVEVTTVTDGAQALLNIATVRPDVLITDLAMGPIDGTLLLKTLRSQPSWADLRVVVVSGVLPDHPAPVINDARTVVYAKPLSFDRLAGYLDAQIQRLALGESMDASVPKAVA